MRSRRLAEKLPLAIPAVLVILLASLATLQYHWSGKVSALERQHMRASLYNDGFRFSEDFDREVTRAFIYFHPSPTVPADQPDQRIAGIIREHGRWMAEAPYPQLVRDVYLIRSAAGGPQIEILHPNEQRFVSSSWTSDLAEARRQVESAAARPARGIGTGTVVLAEVPGLLIPVSLPLMPEARASDPAAGIYVLVRFDPQTINQEILPALAQKDFTDTRRNEYVVAVREAEAPKRLLFVSDPHFPASSLGEGDMQVGMFGLRPFDELRAVSAEHGFPVHRRHSERRSDTSEPRMAGPPPEGHHRYGVWRLVMKHRDGSLEEAVAANRLRNLAISLGILGLLGITSGMMFVAAQRAQRLARQQIEFVAGVTHELHTPLTAIRSAGQNLADGVVADPAQVKRYGTLIESEGRRLSDMVGQALEFAGIQSGRRVYHPRPAGVEEIVGGALQDCRWLLQEKRIQVEREIEPGLPSLMADAAALRRAVANLIENAVKYGGRGAWIGVRVRRDPAGPVEITVADHGPGIRKEDLPHLFEPFFRGREGATAGVPGSGLGLSLVRHVAEAHGGQVTVDTGPEGTAFTLRLPARDAEEAVEGVEAPA